MAPCPQRTHNFVGKTGSRNSSDIEQHYTSKLCKASPSDKTLAEGSVAVTKETPTECQERFYQEDGS